MKPLVLIGGGGHCKSVIEAAGSQGREILGVLDLPENVGSEILGCKIIGTDDDIAQFTGRAEFVITVGHIKGCAVREKIDLRIKQCEGVLATITASTAHVSPYARIGEGTVVLHGAMVNASARIGRNCIINTLANIEHDTVIEDFCHVSTGAMVNGNCTVGRGTFLGSQSVIVNGVAICENCVIAAGSLIRKSVIRPGVYAGSSAQLMIRR